MLSLRRKIPSNDLAFSAGAQVSQALPRAFLVEGYDLSVDGDLVVSGGTTSGTATAAAVQHALISSVKIIANGSRVLKHLTGEELRQYLHYTRGAYPAQVAVSGTLAAATYAFELHLHIPARILRAAVYPGAAGAMGFRSFEELTSLPAWSYSELTLEITYGDATVFYTGGDRSYAFSGVTVDLYERYADSRSLTASQKKALVYPTPMFERKTFTVTAAQADFEMELSTAVGKDIARIFIGARSDSALSNAVVNSFSLKGDDTVSLLEEITWKASRAFTKQTLGLQSDLEAGWAVIDFMEDQNLAQILSTAPTWEKLHIKADVSHPGTTDQIVVIVESVQA